MAEAIVLEGAVLQTTPSFGVPPETFSLTHLKSRPLPTGVTAMNPSPALGEPTGVKDAFFRAAVGVVVHQRQLGYLNDMGIEHR